MTVQGDAGGGQAGTRGGIEVKFRLEIFEIEREVEDFDVASRELRIGPGTAPAKDKAGGGDGGCSEGGSAEKGSAAVGDAKLAQ